MLLFAVGFNLWLYRLEPTAMTDPNDNTFQFALVDRTNTIWDFASKKCSESALGILIFPLCHFSYLSDHWVHNWAGGYNLPYYYSHIPQIAIVGSYRFIHWSIGLLDYSFISLFAYYHIIIYLLLCFFPVSVYLALLVIGVSPLTAGIGAILATNLSTDGLYGLDPSSFLWRGYGLSSQLFAMIWLPLALAYAFRFFQSEEDRSKYIVTKYLIPAVLFVTLTTSGHLGIGMITMLSLGFHAISTPIVKLLQQESQKEILYSLINAALRLSLVAGLSIFLLSYWILPTFIDGNFHNISFWDPVWKFDSYGAKETMIRLFNGDIFDFGRLPIITMLTIVGAIVGISGFKINDLRFKNNTDESLILNPKSNILYPFSFLFIFWILFYFGRTTWGGLIDLIPGMKDFHLSRFLVGVHVAGMLLAPIGFDWIVKNVSNLATRYSPKKLPHWIIGLLVYLVIGLLLLPPVFKWTTTYNELNDRLIVQANGNYLKVKTDEQALFKKLRSLPPARIFAGRGGSFGKRFQVAETPYYMHLSTYGLPTSLWLPETWSMNSDTEQYFSENQAKDYDLYNLRWVAAPPDETPQEFWKEIAQAPTWKLYEVPTSGYFTTGIRPATISIGKQNFMSIVHLWIQSEMHANGLYPEMTFDKNYPKTFGLPNFKMLDEVTYQTPDGLSAQSGKKHNIWSEPPVYLPPGITSMDQYAKLDTKNYFDIRLIGPEKVETDMIYSTTVEVGKKCAECVVVFKQTAHPGWKAYIDGKPAKTMIVFPFYTGVLIPEGTHQIKLVYEPSLFKKILLLLALVSSVSALYIVFKNRKPKLKS